MRQRAGGVQTLGYAPISQILLVLTVGYFLVGQTWKYFVIEEEATDTIVNVPQRLQYTQHTESLQSVSIVNVKVTGQDGQQQPNTRPQTLGEWAASMARAAQEQKASEDQSATLRSLSHGPAVQFRDEKVADKKQLRIVVAMKDFPPQLLTKEAEETCTREIAEKCGWDEPMQCIYDVMTISDHCNHCKLPPNKFKYKKTYWLGIKRSVPYLQQAGWNIETVSIGVGTAEQTIEKADVLITFGQLALRNDTAVSFAQHPDKRYIIIDTSDSATLYTLIDASSPQILAIIKHSRLQPPSLNNGPLHATLGTAHMMWMPGENTAYHRDPPLGPDDLRKFVAMVPHIFTWRYPLDGARHSNLNWLRFAGFFQANSTLWQPPPLQNRTYDVGFVGSTHYKYSPEVSAHRQLSVEMLDRLALLRPHLNVLNGTFLDSYSQYIATLMSIKVFVSPFGMGEWSLKDYEAIMCGCVLVKPHPQYVVAYPNIYQPDKAVIGVRPDFADLPQVVDNVLGDMAAAAGVVQYGQQLLRKFADDERHAKVWDTFLAQMLADGYPIEPEVV